MIYQYSDQKNKALILINVASLRSLRICSIKLMTIYKTYHLKSSRPINNKQALISEVKKLATSYITWSGPVRRACLNQTLGLLSLSQPVSRIFGFSAVLTRLMTYYDWVLTRIQIHPTVFLYTYNKYQSFSLQLVKAFLDLCMNFWMKFQAYFSWHLQIMWTF